MRTTTANRLLWTLQCLLAALFLFAGGMKLILPLAMLRGPVELPGPFLRFIGVAEVLGALGLVLPGLLGIRRSLTSYAATGLVTIMSGAAIITVEGGSWAGALLPLAVGLIAATIAVGRRRWGASPSMIGRDSRLRLGRAA